MDEDLIGRQVTIRSPNGIDYFGVVRSVRKKNELGELFELGSDDHPTYQRFVYVLDREGQIALADET